MKKLFTILFLFIACISNAQTVSISSSAAPSNTICSGTNVTFTANATGFTNPYYQWYKNSVAIGGATSATFSSASLVNGDQVNVKVNEGPFGGAVTSNGLLLNLDATNPSSYSGSGTTWNNLVTGNAVPSFSITSGTYVNSNGGVIRFPSTGGFAESTTGFANLTAYTVEVWVKSAGTNGVYNPELNSNYAPSLFSEKVSGGTVNMVLAYNARAWSGVANNSYRYTAAMGGWQTVESTTNYGSDLNNWVQIVATYNGSVLKLYRNGVELGSKTANINLRASSVGYYVAHRWDMIDGVYGDYSKVMMYNKALTSTEVSANYSAFNARFVDNGVSSSAITTTVNASPAVPVLTVLGDGCINKSSLTTTSGLTSYVWYKDNINISGITTNTLTPNASGDYKVMVSNGTCSNTSSVTTIYSCGKTSEGKMSPITSSTTLVAISGKINSTYGVDERGLILNSITPVTTGLILYLDAGNLSSYSGSGTNWTDLSDRGNNGTLVGGVTYNSSNQGSLVFNGNSSGTTDSYVSLPATTDFAFGSGDFTVEMWIYANSGNNVSTFISINSSSGYAALRLENYLSNNLDAFHSSDGASHLIGKMSTSITANKWTHLVFSRINGNAKIYLDGVEKLSYALVGSLVASGNSRIGSLPGFTDRNHSGNIAITRIYKGKGLTSTEVTTQFDLLKSRFGL